MLTLPPGTRLWVAAMPVDGRKGIDGLSALIRSHLGKDPLSGELYVFFTKRANRVRVLYFDRDGYVLVTKRLEKGRFRMPWVQHGEALEVEAAELLLVLEGIELASATRRQRWSPRRRAA